MALTDRQKNLILSAIGDPDSARAISAQIDEGVAILTADITDGAVTEAKLAPQSAAEGLQASRVARVVYDFATDGGAVGSINLGAILPIKAVVKNAFLDVVTAMTSAGGAGTIRLDSEAAGDLLAAVDADTLSGRVQGVPTGAVATMKKMTAARQLVVTIGVEALTAGKFVLFVEYFVSA